MPVTWLDRIDPELTRVSPSAHAGILDCEKLRLGRVYEGRGDPA